MEFEKLQKIIAEVLNLSEEDYCGRIKRGRK